MSDKKSNKKLTILYMLLCVLLASILILSCFCINLYKQLDQTNIYLVNMTAQNESTIAVLTATETALSDMTEQQEATAAKLMETENILSETETALADMTKKHEETAANLVETGKALTETRSMLADKTEQQEATAAKLTETENILSETETALADMTKKHEETAAKLVATENTLSEAQSMLADKTEQQEATTVVLAASEKNLSEIQTMLANKVMLQQTVTTFITGYEKAAFAKYNSLASENGLADSRIFILGTLDKTEILDASGNPTILGYVTDDTGSEWLIMLHVYPMVSVTAFDSYIGEKIVLRGVYSGYSGVKQMPVIVLDEMIVLDTGENVVGMQKLLD